MAKTEGRMARPLLTSLPRETLEGWSSIPGLLSFVLLLLFLAACTGQVPRPEGWSGGAVAGDALYMGTRDGRLVALDRASGETRWRFELKGEQDRDHAIYGKPAVVGDTVYVGGYDGLLYALSLNGNLKWQERVGGPIVGSPAVVDGTVLVGAGDGRLYALDVADGTVKWSFPTGDKVWSTPAVADGVVYFGSLDHNVYAVSLADGRELWKFPAGGAVRASPVVADGQVYVGAFDNVFYAIDAATGRETWRFDEARNWLWGDAIVHDGAVYVPSLDGNLYALSKDTKERLWTVKTNGPIVGAPVVIFDMLAVASDDGRLRLVRLRDGVELDACNIGAGIRASLTAEGDVIYLGARDHSIRALRVKSNGNPDEVWVHLTNRDDPIPRGRAPAC
jgi:outer membrane protein assembly factor BamB